jgi:hypothetical protein
VRTRLFSGTHSGQIQKIVNEQIGFGVSRVSPPSLPPTRQPPTRQLPVEQRSTCFGMGDCCRNATFYPGPDTSVTIQHESLPWVLLAFSCSLNEREKKDRNADFDRSAHEFELQFASRCTVQESGKART